MIRFATTGVAVLAALLVSVASTSFAQTNTEDFAQFEFNFSSPGARATGIGGAFISIADDATAAETNPAGLTALISPELSFEIKGINYNREVIFETQGTIGNFTTTSREFQNSVVFPSFMSVSYPFEGKNLTGSLFRYELMKFESTFYNKERVVDNTTGPLLIVAPVTSQIEMNVVNWGAAGGYKFNENFSAGLSAGISTIDTQSELDRFSVSVFDNAALSNTATIDDSAVNFFFNLGLLYKPNEKLSVGATFKRRPKFELDHEFRILGFVQDSVSVKKINVNVPSAIGAGLSYRFTDVFTMSFDANWIMYSQLTDDFTITISEGAVFPSDYEAKDGIELRLGAEYVTFVKSSALVLRAGGYLEPTSAIQFVGAAVPDTDPAFADREIDRFLFVEGDNEFHFTFGLGLVLNNHIQIDGAGDLSPGSNQIVGSVVLRK